MQLLIVLALCLFSTSAIAQDESWFPEPTQNPQASFRLFRTKNIYTLLKLDTRTGQIWQIQWSNDDTSRFSVPLNRTILVPPGTPGHPATLKPGRFTLSPTSNIYNFVLIDEEDGRIWQVQWGEEKQRLILPIE
jgi:hypothetical protein